MAGQSYDIDRSVVTDEFLCDICKAGGSLIQTNTNFEPCSGTEAATEAYVNFRTVMNKHLTDNGQKPHDDKKIMSRIRRSRSQYDIFVNGIATMYKFSKHV